MNEKCEKCAAELTLSREDREFDIKGFDHPCVVTDILIHQCPHCGSAKVTEEGQRYIKIQQQIFRRRGIHSMVQDVLDQENLSWDHLAGMFGTSKMNLHQQINKTTKVSFALCCEIAIKLNRQLRDCFRYYPLELKGDKYYLNKNIDLF